MINIALVGGRNVEDMVSSIDLEKYNVSKKHQFTNDLFEDMLDNSAEYLDINVIIVLPYGIQSEISKSQEEQIRDIQEIVNVCRLNSKLYFVLNDQDLYNRLENSEEPIVYPDARILMLQKVHNKRVMEIIEGKLDDQGICMELEEPLDEYTEDLIDLEDTSDLEEDEKIFSDDNIIDHGLTIDEDNQKTKGKSIKDLRQNKKFGSRISNKLSEDAVYNPVTAINDRGFNGVLAVTGDRSSGVSSTVSLIAETYAKQNKTVLIIDMDTIRRYQSLIYPDFNDYEEISPKSQQGLYYALNNTQALEKLLIIVKDNVALLGNSRKSEYYSSPFVDKSLDSVLTSTRLSTLVGVAKGVFDIVILDFPLEQINKLIEATIIVDRFILCVENSVNLMDTLFNIYFAKLMDLGEIYVDSIISKSSVVLTKYSQHNKYSNKELTERDAEKILQTNVAPRLGVIGKISYSNVFNKLGFEKKSPIELHDLTRDELINIVNNIK